MAATTQAQTETERRILDLCSKENKETDAAQQLKVTLESSSGLRVDATDKDGMTALMHAAYGGKLELCQILLNNGADVNSNLHTEGYTVLMFATIAGHPSIVKLLLDFGANTSATNHIGRTAAQMGGFVGQTECAQLINSYFSIEDLTYYTKPQGLETSPKLDPSLLLPLHDYITITNIHPVRLLLMLQSTGLFQYQSQVCKVLSILCEKTMKEDKEPFSLKLHLLSYTIRECCQTGLDPLLKNLLTQTETGFSLEVEKYLRQCLKGYPHVHSVLLKQLIASVAKIPLGQHPTTLSLVISAILGNRMGLVDNETCSTCGLSNDKLKKCSKCKKVWYCNVECQRLAWSVGNHRKLCKKWTQDFQQT